MNTNNKLINIEGKNEFIDTNELKNKIREQIESNHETILKEEHAQTISPSRFEFTYDLVMNLSRKRKEMNMTQAELSRKSKVNRATISKIESFQRLVVNLDVILNLLDALNLKLSISEKE